MFKVAKSALILVLICGLVSPLCAASETGYLQPIEPVTVEANCLPNNNLQQKQPAILIKQGDYYISFDDWINNRAYPFYVEKKSEKQKLREDWETALGYDIFMPYFKVDEIKEKVEEKSVVKVKKIRGKAVIHEDEAKYIFSIKF